MFVLEELKKSIKTLEDTIKNLESVNDLTTFDSYESNAQKVVFNLQMQANQVAGQFVPMIMNKRANLQTTNAQAALDRVRAKQQQIQDKISSLSEEPKEVKVEDDENSNRQRKSKAGNSKSKSSSKTK